MLVVISHWPGWELSVKIGTVLETRSGSCLVSAQGENIVGKFIGGLAVGLLVGLMLSRTEIGQLLTDLIFSIIDALVDVLRGPSEDGAVS